MIYSRRVLTALTKASLLACSIAAAQAQSMQPADLAAMKTDTVDATLVELRKDPDRVFAEHGGWVVGEKSIDGGSELWSFTPEGHDAHPAAVQRLITNSEGAALKIKMTIQCDAEASACEALEKLFTVMNENLIAVSEIAPPEK